MGQPFEFFGLRTLGEVLKPGLFLEGIPYMVKMKRQVYLMHYLQGSAKMAIWLTRKRKAMGCGSPDLVEVFGAMVGAESKLSMLIRKWPMASKVCLQYGGYCRLIAV